MLCVAHLTESLVCAAGDTAGIHETAELTQPAVAASTAHADAAVLGVVLAGLLLVVALAAVVAVKYKRTGGQKYEPVQQKELEAPAHSTNSTNASQLPDASV